MRLSIILFLFLPFGLAGQPNCNFFLYKGDTLQYQACKLVEDIDKKYYQFSREYQEIMDEALQICPYFAYAYREKAAPYVKSGDFLTWKKLIDKAVNYAPLEYLHVRASLRYKFFADYSGAIKDINLLDAMVDYDIGSSSDGTYHLNIVKALCYKELGKAEEAVLMMEDQLGKQAHVVSSYDYLHLGVLYQKTKLYSKAIAAFQKQEKFNNLAENQFYVALVFKELGKRDAYLSHLQKAKQLYVAGNHMRDPYNQLIDEIFLEDIEAEIKTAYNKN